ncbi:UNVERIFIED_CONTAM: hypothetical protein HDU68_009417 [Siphonaria sp. JEL0065]|nr:hypothetical protein HDU68_009417 [Siphonaria sp. JEL0065]
MDYDEEIVLDIVDDDGMDEVKVSVRESRTGALLDMEEMVEAYISKCEYMCSTNLDVRNPYPSSYLPEYASAYAYDIVTMKGYPPSVQILCQYLNLHKKSNREYDRQYADYLSISYVLISCGIVFINSRPYVSKNETLNVKLDSYTSELIISMIKVLAQASCKSLSIMKIGSVAERTVSAAVYSCSQSVTSKIRIATYEMAEPSALSRRYGVNESPNALDTNNDTLAVAQTIRQTIRISSKSISKLVKPGIRMLGSENGYYVLVKKFDSINISEAQKRFLEVMTEHNSGNATGSSSRANTKTTYMHDVIDASWRTVFSMNSEWKETSARCNSILAKLEATDDIEVVKLRDELAQLLLAVKVVQKNMVDAAANFNGINNAAFGKDSPMTGKTGHIAPVATLVTNSKSGDVLNIKPVKLKSRVVTPSETTVIRTGADQPTQLSQVSSKPSQLVHESANISVPASKSNSVTMSTKDSTSPKSNATPASKILGALKSMAEKMKRDEAQLRQDAIASLGPRASEDDILTKMNELRLKAKAKVPPAIPTPAPQTPSVTVNTAIELEVSVTTPAQSPIRQSQSPVLVQSMPLRSRTTSATSTGSRLISSKPSVSSLKSASEDKPVKKPVLRAKQIQ